MRLLRDRLLSAVNAIDALERMDLAEVWGIHGNEEKRATAVRLIEKQVAVAANTIATGRR